LISAAALLIGVLIGLAISRFRIAAASQKPVVYSTVKVEPGYILDGERINKPYGIDPPTPTAMAISGDGRYIVYAADARYVDPGRLVFLRRALAGLFLQ
jgi:hypothetical protein